MISRRPEASARQLSSWLSVSCVLSSLTQTSRRQSTIYRYASRPSSSTLCKCASASIYEYASARISHLSFRPHPRSRCCVCVVKIHRRDKAGPTTSEILENSCSAVHCSPVDLGLYFSWPGLSHSSTSLSWACAGPLDHASQNVSTMLRQH